MNGAEDIASQSEGPPGDVRLDSGASDVVAGAYGLALCGLGGGAGLLAEPPSDWPQWSVSQQREDVNDHVGAVVRERDAIVGLPGSGQIWLDRDRREIVFATRTELSHEAIVHPGLSPAAAVVSYWTRRPAFHAAAVVVNGSAWALIGGRGQGKSTTASILMAAGHQLLTDDLLVLGDNRAFAGPAIIDLRADAAARLGGTALGRVGSRERWRQAADGRMISCPLAGWILLEWSDGQQSLEDVPVRERLEQLGASQAAPIEPLALLDVITRPVLRFRRPRDLDLASACCDRLLDSRGTRTRQLSSRTASTDCRSHHVPA